MNSPNNRSLMRAKHRTGFTLTELLVVIAIIGILIGTLAVALAPAIWRTDEAVITNEVMQLDAAIRRFKEEYGFYPPDFTNINSAADMGQYLNKISRNHAEFSAFPNGHPRQGEIRLEVWWEVYGQYVRNNRQAALVFWLSHLFKNAQYPLTAGASTSEYDQFFTFKNDRLYPVANDGNVIDLPSVYMFVQAAGPEIPYAYFNYRDYSANAIVPPEGGLVPSNGSAAPYLQNTTSGTFFNPESFQIIAAGLDGQFGAGDWLLIGDTAHKGDQDNITNFAEGINQTLLE